MENTSTISGAEIRAEIERANEKFMDAFRRKDAAGIAAFYTDNGMVMPPNSELFEGRQQVEEFWKATMGMGIMAVQLETREIEQCNDMAFEMGQAILLGEDDMELDRAKYIVVWKRENGTWKLHRDIFNSNRALQ